MSTETQRQRSKKEEYDSEKKTKTTKNYKQPATGQEKTIELEKDQSTPREIPEGSSKLNLSPQVLEESPEMDNTPVKSSEPPKAEENGKANIKIEDQKKTSEPKKETSTRSDIPKGNSDRNSLQEELDTNKNFEVSEPSKAKDNGQGEIRLRITDRNSLQALEERDTNKNFEVSEPSKAKDNGQGEIRPRVLIFLYVTLAISFVALAAFVSYHFLSKPKADTLDYPKIFETGTKEIQKLFPNQTKRFWSILKSHSLVHLRNKNPDQPLVILLGAPPSAHAVVNCLAKKLAWCLDPNVSPSNFIDGTKYSKDDGHNTKKILDDKLTDMFDRGARAALVMHLEQLPPPSPLLFYKYCDNDQAPYKHAGIIFTVYLRHEISASLSPVEAEGSIEKFLSNDAWGQSPYDRDSVLALLSRIADNVALVSHESDEVVQSVCHDVQ